MQTADFISEELLLEFYYQMIPTSQQKFDAGTSFSSSELISLRRVSFTTTLSLDWSLF